MKPAEEYYKHPAPDRGFTLGDILGCLAIMGLCILLAILGMCI